MFAESIHFLWPWQEEPERSRPCHLSGVEMEIWRNFFFIDRMMARCAKIESRVSTTSSGKRKFVTCPSQNHWWWFVQERPKETQAALASNPRDFASVGGFGSTS